MRHVPKSQTHACIALHDRAEKRQGRCCGITLIVSQVSSQHAPIKYHAHSFTHRAYSFTHRAHTFTHRGQF